LCFFRNEADVLGAPAMLTEKFEIVRRVKAERRIFHFYFLCNALPAASCLRRQILGNPMAKGAFCPQIVGERCDFFRAEIGNDALGKHQRFVALARDLGEKLPACRPVREIQSNAFQVAARLFGRQSAFFEIDDFWIIHFDPTERLGKIHPVGARIQTGAEIEDKIGPVGNRGFNERVNDAGADRNDPFSEEGALRQVGDDLLAARSSELSRQGIAE
jgi:hypothetical protein